MRSSEKLSIWLEADLALSSDLAFFEVTKSKIPPAGIELYVFKTEGSMSLMTAKHPELFPQHFGNAIVSNAGDLEQNILSFFGKRLLETKEICIDLNKKNHQLLKDIRHYSERVALIENVMKEFPIDQLYCSFDNMVATSNPRFLEVYGSVSRKVRDSDSEYYLNAKDPLTVFLPEGVLSPDLIELKTSSDSQLTGQMTIALECGVTDQSEVWVIDELPIRLKTNAKLRFGNPPRIKFDFRTLEKKDVIKFELSPIPFPTAKYIIGGQMSRFGLKMKCFSMAYGFGSYNVQNFKTSTTSNPHKDLVLLEEGTNKVALDQGIENKIENGITNISLDLDEQKFVTVKLSPIPNCDLFFMASSDQVADSAVARLTACFVSKEEIETAAPADLIKTVPSSISLLGSTNK